MYLLALIVIMGLAVIRLLQSILPAMKGNSGVVTLGYFRILAIDMLPAALILAPMYLAAFYALADGGPIVKTWLAVVASAIGAMLVIAVAATRLYRHRSTLSFASVGLFVVPVLSAGICLVAACSQLWYTRGAESSVVYTDFFKDQVTDIACDSPVILARWSGSAFDPVRYRCPTGPVLHAVNLDRPFIPWPSYTEGSSRELARVLRKLMDEAGESRPNP